MSDKKAFSQYVIKCLLFSKPSSSFVSPKNCSDQTGRDKRSHFIYCFNDIISHNAFIIFYPRLRLLCFQVSLVVAAMLGVIMYRVAVTITLAKSQDFDISWISLFASFTAATVNLICIMILNKVCGIFFCSIRITLSCIELN